MSNKITGKHVAKWVMEDASKAERSWLEQLCRALEKVDEYSTALCHEDEEGIS